MADMTPDDPRRFVRQKRIQYRCDKPDTIDSVLWIVFDRFRKSAAHFHGTVYVQPPDRSLVYARELRSGQFAGMYFVPYGIELHSPTPLHEGQKPIAGGCGVLSGTCYPDGTSLGASRFCEWWLGDDESAFREVHAWLTRNEGGSDG